MKKQKLEKFELENEIFTIQKANDSLSDIASLEENRGWIKLKKQLTENIQLALEKIGSIGASNFDAEKETIKMILKRIECAREFIQLPESANKMLKESKGLLERLKLEYKKIRK